jgi:hypothetical protein
LSRSRAKRPVCVLFGLLAGMPRPSFAADEPARVIVNSFGLKLAPSPAGKFRMDQDGSPSDYQFIKHPEKFDDAH